MTPEERQQFVEDYEKLEGINIDINNITSNPGLRNISKLMLNSLWGKFAQRANNSTVELATSPNVLHKLLQDKSVEVIDLCHLSEEKDRIIYRKKTEFVEAPPTNNLPVACYVTSHARLHLYSFIEQVEQIGAELLYCDTDSLLYVRKLEGGRVTEGDRLGQMAREFKDRKIVEFLSAGPKNYAFRHVDINGQNEQAVLKIRGFELNYSASQKITFETMKHLVFQKFGKEQRFYFIK